MNATEAMAFLEQTKSYGSRLGLESIRNLMEELDNVQDRIPVIHIGGTNGKGSVGAFLSSALSSAGYRVCRFQTPDVFSYEEEFLLNGAPIQKERLAQLFTTVQAACDRLTARKKPHPTWFEVETAAAFLWFYEEQPDIALVEVGMGGETDATNVIGQPLISVLTSISRDHMQFLGETLEEIAAVKAGIIKPACPVVSVAQPPEVAQVLMEKCLDCQSELYWSDTKAVGDMPLGLLGAYQAENAGCALRVLQLLQDRYPKLTDEAIREGFLTASWPGRFEQIACSPDVFIDGAHNAGAALRLKETLEADFARRRICYIMGVLADKEYEEMVRILFQSGDLVYTVTPPSPRALPADLLAGVLQKYRVQAMPCETFREAAEKAVRSAGAEGVVLALGSLSYLRDISCEIRKLLK